MYAEKLAKLLNINFESPDGVLKEFAIKNITYLLKYSRILIVIVVYHIHNQ